MEEYDRHMSDVNEIIQTKKLKIDELYFKTPPSKRGNMYFQSINKLAREMEDDKIELIIEALQLFLCREKGIIINGNIDIGCSSRNKNEDIKIDIHIHRMNIK